MFNNDDVTSRYEQLWVSTVAAIHNGTQNFHSLFYLLDSVILSSKNVVSLHLN